MFIPIGDDNRDRRTTPYINYLFIAINILVFVFLQGMGSDWKFTYAYATVPAEILTGDDVISHSKVLTDVVTGERIQVPGLQVTPINVYLTLITSMFMHGGWAHLGGNMLFLHVFGDNLEDAMGHRRYLYFYLLCGLLAAISHVLFTAFSSQSVYTPSLGASGAISGVMGGYMLLFPTRSVHMWIFFLIISVPAIIAVGLWFVFQVINGMGMLGGDDASGVAYAAHIGGFIAGLLLVKAFAKRGRVQLIKKEEPGW
jgi:membrane associated rhomboid family serine protease